MKTSAYTDYSSEPVLGIPFPFVTLCWPGRWVPALNITRMRRRSVWVLAASLVLAFALAGYWFVRHGWLHVQGALAEEQTLYFEEARDKALQSTRPEEIAQCIKGTLTYYPSGSKQTCGSHLDRMVERARRLTVDDMMRHLRHMSGQDLGNEPQKWLERFAKEIGRAHV